MSTLNEVGERDAWRCWLCDEPVDPGASVNAARGPSVDSGASPKGKKAAAGAERLAHRACNTRKGAVKPVVAWSPDLFVVEPAPIVASVERLTRKGGREVVGRCPSQADAETWVGESWQELLAAGVEQVHLLNGGERVYGPMSLRPLE